MLFDGQLSTRNMVNAVNEEFWKMVKGSIDEQNVVFSGMSFVSDYNCDCWNIPNFSKKKVGG